MSGWGLPPITAASSGVFPPSAFGLQAYTVPPNEANGTLSIIGGDVVACQLLVPVAVTVSTFWISVTTAGVTLTAGQCLGGVYTASGVQQATIPDQSGVWTATGNKSALLSSSIVLAPPYVWGLVVANGTTPPAFRSEGPAPSVNLGQQTPVTSGVPLIAQLVQAGQTALPGSFNPLSAAAHRNQILIGLA